MFKYLHNYYGVDHNDLFYVNVPIFHCTQGNQLKLSKLPVPQHTVGYSIISDVIMCQFFWTTSCQ